MFIYNNTDILNPDDSKLRPMNGFPGPMYAQPEELRVLSGSDQYIDPFISEIGSDDAYGDKTGLRTLSGLGQATYTDAQVAQALRESMAQGFSLLDSISGAIRVFGVPVDQAYRAADLVAVETTSKPATGAASLVVADETNTTTVQPDEIYSDAQVTQAVRESVAQGFTLTDSVVGLVRVYDVPLDQANRAGNVVAQEIQAQATKAAADAAAAAAKAAADAAAKKLAAETAARAAAEATAKSAADAAAKQAAAAAATKAAADAATKAAAAAAAKSQADAAAAAAGQTTGGNIGPLLLAVAAAFVLGA